MDYYHGSMAENLTMLNPYQFPESNLQKPCVYLTTSRHLALHYIWDRARCPIKMPMLDIRERDVLVFQEMFPNALKYFYQGLSGFIYHCVGDYAPSPGSRVSTCAVSDAPVPVADFERIEDVYTEILSYEKRGLFLYERVETLPLRRVEQIRSVVRNMMAHYNVLALPESEIARFFKEKFPAYWEEALQNQ